MAKKVTILDVASRVGVSKTVVSNFLNSKYDTMSMETRNKIENVIKELNYEPEKNRRNYKGKSMKTIGLVIADITDSFYSMLCKGVTDASLALDCHVLIANTDNNLLREKGYIESFLGKTDGLIIGTVGNNDDFLCSLKNKTSIVLADRSTKINCYDVVSSNNYQAVNEMLRYLFALGYETFGLFTEELSSGMARTIRVKSFVDFVEQNSIGKKASVHTINIYDEKVMMRELMGFVEKSKNSKTVAIGVNGRSLLQLITCLNTLNLKAPRDIGVCGYDDFDWAPLIHSGIATINQPSYDIGYTATEKLIERINQKSDFIPETIELRSKLTIRGSI